MKSTWINLFKVIISEKVGRIIFGDAVIGNEGDFHTSITMSREDMKELSNLIDRVLSEDPNKKVDSPTS